MRMMIRGKIKFKFGEEVKIKSFLAASQQTKNFLTIEIGFSIKCIFVIYLEIFFKK